MSSAQLAAVSYLARYSGHTHNLYAYQLRQWFAWCQTSGLDPLVGIQRAHVELYIRQLGDRGLLDSSVVTMMHAVRGYFRFAHIDGLIPSDPAVYARLPKVHRRQVRPLQRAGAGRSRHDDLASRRLSRRTLASSAMPRCCAWQNRSPSTRRSSRSSTSSVSACRPARCAATRRWWSYFATRLTVTRRTRSTGASTNAGRGRSRPGTRTPSATCSAPRTSWGISRSSSATS